MRDENQCLHGRNAHVPLAFASHTLSSHFRISEDAMLFGGFVFLLKVSCDPEADDGVAAIRAAADAVGHCAVAIHLHPISSTNSASMI